MKPIHPDIYPVIMIDCIILHLPIVNQRRNSVESHRCLNYTLEIEEGVNAGDKVYGCIPLDNTSGKYAPIVQFFRQIGWFRDLDNFDETELNGLRAKAETGILFDKRLGLHSYVIRFHPLTRQTVTPC